MNDPGPSPSGPEAATPPPAEPPAPPGKPGSRTEKTWGVVAVVTAAAILGGRYTLLPLELEPRWLSSAITGGAVGLLVAAWNILRHGRGPIRWPVAAGAGVLSAAAALGALVLSGPKSLDETPLETLDHRAFSMSVPAWEDTSRSESRGEGRIASRVRNQGYAFTLNWAYTPVQLAELEPLMRGMFAPMGQAEARMPPPVQVGDQEIGIVQLTIPGKMTTTMSVINCPESVTLTIGVLVREGDADPNVLHRRILSSVQCKGPVPAPPPLRPNWTPPAGYVESWNDADGWGFVQNAEGVERYVSFPPAQPNPDMAAEIAATPAMIPGILGMFVSTPKRLLDPAPRTIGGRTRHFYAFSGVDAEDGATLKGLLTAWSCPGHGVTFIGVYLATGGAATEGVPLLSAARCPPAE